jgi:hypothetical protein
MGVDVHIDVYAEHPSSRFEILNSSFQRLPNLFPLRLPHAVRKRFYLPNRRAVLQITDEKINTFITASAVYGADVSRWMTSVQQLKAQFLERVGIEFLERLIQRIH